MTLWNCSSTHVAEAGLLLRQCPTRKDGLQIHPLVPDLVQQRQALLQEAELGLPGVDLIPGCDGGGVSACMQTKKMGASRESNHMPTERENRHSRSAKLRLPLLFDLGHHALMIAHLGRHVAPLLDERDLARSCQHSHGREGRTIPLRPCRLRRHRSGVPTPLGSEAEVAVASELPSSTLLPSRQSRALC